MYLSPITEGTLITTLTESYKHSYFMNSYLGSNTRMVPGIRIVSSILHCPLTIMVYYVATL